MARRNDPQTTPEGTDDKQTPTSSTTPTGTCQECGQTVEVDQAGNAAHHLTATPDDPDGTEFVAPEACPGTGNPVLPQPDRTAPADTAASPSAQIMRAELADAIEKADDSQVAQMFDRLTNPGEYKVTLDGLTDEDILAMVQTLPAEQRQALTDALGADSKVTLDGLSDDEILALVKELTPDSLQALTDAIMPEPIALSPNLATDDLGKRVLCGILQWVTAGEYQRGPTTLRAKDGTDILFQVADAAYHPDTKALLHPQCLKVTYNPGGPPKEHLDAELREHERGSLAHAETREQHHRKMLDNYRNEVYIRLCPTVLADETPEQVDELAALDGHETVEVEPAMTVDEAVAKALSWTEADLGGLRREELSAYHIAQHIPAEKADHEAAEKELKRIRDRVAELKGLIATRPGPVELLVPLSDEVGWLGILWDAGFKTAQEGLPGVTE